MQDRDDTSRNGRPSFTSARHFGRNLSSEGSKLAAPLQDSPPSTVPGSGTADTGPHHTDSQQRPSSAFATNNYLVGPGPRVQLPAINIQDSSIGTKNVTSSTQTVSSPLQSKPRNSQPLNELDWSRWHQSGWQDPLSGEPSNFTISEPSQTNLPPLRMVFPTSFPLLPSVTNGQSFIPGISPPLIVSSTTRPSAMTVSANVPSPDRSTLPAPALLFPQRNLPPLPGLSLEPTNRVLDQTRPIAIPVSRMNKIHQSTKVSCTACLDQFDAHSLIRLGCGCNYCSPCLNRLVGSACTSAADFPPKCHGIALRISIYGPTLTSEVSTRYKEVEAEFSSQNPLYCAVSRCSYFIKPENFVQHGRLGVCAKCHERTCTSCKMLLSQHRIEHGERRCPDEPQDVQALRNLSQQKDWMQCPACRSMVEKMDGCDHIACLCGVEFCYHCGSHFDEDDGCQCDTAERQEIDDSDDEEVWPDHRRMFDNIGRKTCWHLSHEATDGELCHGCLQAPADDDDDFYSCNDCLSILCERCMDSNNSDHIAWLEREHVAGIKSIQETHFKPHEGPNSASRIVTDSDKVYTEALQAHRLRMVEQWEAHRATRNETWDEHVARMNDNDFGTGEQQLHQRQNI